MAPRPRLASALRPLVPAGGVVQLGRGTGSEAVLLSGLTAAELAFLDRLDGRRTDMELYAAALDAGVTRRRTVELLALLRHHGVLPADRPPAAGRRDPGGRYVVVDGAGPLASSIAALLRASSSRVDGCVGGRVDGGRGAADAADADLRAGGVDLPDLVVLVSDGGVDPRAGEPWRRRSVPHLPVVADPDRVVVGPWISADPAGPCLECLRLTRLLPLVALATARRTATALPLPVPDADEALVTVGAGMAAMVARSGLHRGAVPAGVSVEVAAPWPRVDHRRWEVHPDCPHHGASPSSGWIAKQGR
jgi:hypothetical protein